MNLFLHPRNRFNNNASSSTRRRKVVPKRPQRVNRKLTQNQGKLNNKTTGAQTDVVLIPQVKNMRVEAPSKLSRKVAGLANADLPRKRKKRSGVGDAVHRLIPPTRTATDATKVVAADGLTAANGDIIAGRDDGVTAVNVMIGGTIKVVATISKTTPTSRSQSSSND